MNVGYIRVSKHEQHEDLQRDALAAATCEKLFTDKISGATEKRKGLEEALAYLRKGGYLCGLEVGSSRALMNPSDRPALRSATS